MEHRSGESSKESCDAFMEWLRSSPVHVEEYLKVASVAQHLRAAADELQFDIDQLMNEAMAQPAGNVAAFPGGDYPAPSSSRVGYGRFVAAAAATFVLFATMAVWFMRDGERFGLPQSFETNHGEQRSWLLPDGSAVNLNSDSEVTVQYDAKERVVNVKRGQAMFQVAHEAQRRFRVVAGDAQVIAVGTQFDVFRRAEGTVVTVVDGKVAVFDGVTPPPAINALIPTDALHLIAGEQVRLDGKTKTPTVSIANLRETVAWVQRQIIFEQRPLQEVAQEFNRYGSVSIEINDEGIRNLPITGVFNAYDTESFIAFLQRLDGVAVAETNGQIAVTRQSGGQDAHVDHK